MIKFFYDTLPRDLFYLREIADPAELIDLPFNFDRQLVTVAVQVLTLAVYFAIQLVRRLKSKYLSDFRFQAPPRFNLFATL